VLTPAKPTSNSTFIQYRAALRLVYKYQRTANVCSLAWDQLWTMPFDDMAKIVKSRKASSKKTNYEEKVRTKKWLLFFIRLFVLTSTFLYVGFSCLLAIHYD
jgi:hypothetical protein